MLDLVKVGIKKIKNTPSHQIRSRLIAGVKKYISNQPYHISLQTASACNLKCKHCFINDYSISIHDGKIKIMQFHDFILFVERLKPIIKNASHFQFSTFEAIMNKHLFRMMDVLLEINPKIKFPFLSNTMLLNDELIQQLTRYPISEINISLDGCTKQTVENFKTEVSFEKIIDTIQRFKQTSLKDKVVVTFVAHQNNVHELPDYVDFVNNLGVKQIYVSNILTFTPELSELALYTKTGNNDAQALFDEAVKRARRNGQHISMPRLKPELMGCQSCESFFIDINGNVAPCDFLAVSTPFTLWGETAQNDPVIMGNIFEQDPLEIYRSKKYKDFQKAHRTGKNLPKECVSCIDAYGLMCSNRINHLA